MLPAVMHGVNAPGLRWYDKSVSTSACVRSAHTWTTNSPPDCTQRDLEARAESLRGPPILYMDAMAALLSSVAIMTPAAAAARAHPVPRVEPRSPPATTGWLSIKTPRTGARWRRWRAWPKLVFTGAWRRLGCGMRSRAAETRVANTARCNQLQRAPLQWSC